MSQPLLSVEGLTTVFNTTAHGRLTAVDDVSFSINSGQSLSIVGESGCGKSVTSLSIMRLIPSPPGKITTGKILFEGTDLLTLPEKEMQRVRGNAISMIFQEPMTSLNPVFKIGEQIAEVLRLHEKLDKKAALARAIDLLHEVGIPSPAQRAKEFPHQLSGGMRQRVVIAMALACSPRLIIADEPTTALDVTIQGQILDLMHKLAEDTGTALLLITHDLGVVAENADDVVVMYSGRVIEQASTQDLFANPLHPYTQGLIQSIPTIPAKGTRIQKGMLETIPGSVAPLYALPEGCRFHERCKHVFDKCKKMEPPLLRPEANREVRCWLYE
ncbi:ABC transporter ATP-binding protein [Halodesulfovibrio spirochaetisodalis]|uniref:Peptide ABC transporter ATP-binding protein n=1 Tax=Halodesulfovibrio spirochaetisodalis TaxID=1560234 RepID=A0A1B7XAQ6_9BACT|nr:ABC transporter ATP-binding protein [Halodesulfovibrio spirochaetisodalis]OBQ46452.1 peptide ABC transporter ATP-binding protein [Halodesulfovibrio spirochaetisodalis]